MITTRFLSTDEYPEYATWLKNQNEETRSIYFGINFTDEIIDNLVKKFVENSKQHWFLVAEYRGQWIGTIHIAQCSDVEVEFGFIVDPLHRGHGIADRLMEEALTWSRNRGFKSVFMHCLARNAPIKHLCIKHGMALETEYGDTETKLPLPPADFSSVTQEVITRNRNVYRTVLQSIIPFFDEVYG
jgi:RimJ/RimL family protein N-acetyltransferase